MKILFTDRGWKDYLWWQTQDRATLRKINRMIAEASRDPGVGIGKPERLSENFAGFWSRRITAEHRLVYTMQEGALVIAQVRYHY